MSHSNRFKLVKEQLLLLLHFNLATKRFFTSCLERENNTAKVRRKIISMFGLYLNRFSYFIYIIP